MAEPRNDERPALTGRFITFEGIDGCGKSTQARLLAERLKAAGLPVLETREPGGTAIGRGLRQVLLDDAHQGMHPQCELLLYLADRLQHLEECVGPALRQGRTVICDRFHDATEAYQRYGRQLDFALVEPLIAATIAPHMPHLTLWLDLDVASAQQRIAARLAQTGAMETGTVKAGSQSRLDNESLDFHERVRDGYETLYHAHRERIVRIPGADSVDDTERRIWGVIQERYHVP